MDDAPRPVATRADELWGGGLRALLPEREAGPPPSALTPWPTAPRRRGDPLFDRALVGLALRAVPRLVDLDPRALFASQPYVLGEGVAYYLERAYHRTGRTWADGAQLGNQFPLIWRRRDGRQVILGGHHRSAAAVLAGLPVRALVVDEGGGSMAAPAAGAATPSLLVGASSPLDAAVVSSAAEGLAAIDAGATVRTDDDVLALALLTEVMPAPEARWRVDRARRGLRAPSR
ncbi:MAG: hypothetical protein ACR2JF_18210 [Iamia sp.]